MQEKSQLNSSLHTPLLTDFYQINMCFSYWVAGKHNDPAVFEVFFRKSPFKGKYALLAGIDQVLDFMEQFHFSPQDIAYLKQTMPYAQDAFFQYLATMDLSQVRISGIKRETIVFPRQPLLRLEGPLAIIQLLETPILNFTNYPSLVATCAYRMKRVVADPKVRMLEFGLRRAQGPNGGMTASKYAVLGGFDSTSNVLAGKEYGVPISGTCAHSFIQSCSAAEQAGLVQRLKDLKVNGVNLLQRAKFYRSENNWDKSDDSELLAFVLFAYSQPSKFLVVVDSYNTLKSGVPNFLAVGLALKESGNHPLGIRLDSGDLASLSKAARSMFEQVDAKYKNGFSSIRISASNNLDQNSLFELKEKGHSINAFGIGTSLVTCKGDPALGMVFKLTKVGDEPRIKLSEEVEKITIPDCKRVVRIYKKGSTVPLFDLLLLAGEAIPTELTTLYDPYSAENKEIKVDLSECSCEELYIPLFENSKRTQESEGIQKRRDRIQEEGKQFPESLFYHKEASHYHVYLSETVHKLMNALIEKAQKK